MGKVITTDRSSGELQFKVGTQQYFASIALEALSRGVQLALFDGFIPAGGLPRGAGWLPYVYQPHDEPDPRDFALPKQIAVVEHFATVKKCDAYAVSLWEYQERVRRADDTIIVFVPRCLLVIPIGHTVLTRRIKPRSLAYQHTTVEATQECVIFRTIVN